MSKLANEQMSRSLNRQPDGGGALPTSSQAGKMPSGTHHWQLLVVLLVYLILAVAHSLVVPLTTGNDEWAHFLYVRFIAQQGRLPATVTERDEAGYKSDAPPLYHLLAAAVTSGIEPVRLLRPLDPNHPRRYLADNIVDSYALLHTAVEQMPFRGEVLVWHTGRGLSVFFGILLIVVTYITALNVFFGDTGRSAKAAALVAFMPSILFHSSVLSYESLSATLAALFLSAAIKALHSPRRWGWWVIMGVLAGLSVVTKYSAVLLPLEILFVALLAARRSWIISRVFVAGAAMVVAASGWFGFVVWNFNTVNTQGPLVGILQPLLVGDASDTTSVQVASLLFGTGQVADEVRAPLARNYPRLAQSFIESFWAAPVDGQFLLSPWLPLLFSVLALLGLVGLWPVWKRAGGSTQNVLLLFIFHTLLIVPLLVVRVAASYDPREVAQGRHLLLPAASAIAVLLVWGWGHWSKKIAGFAAGGLLLWSVLGQLGWAAVVYPPPVAVWPNALPANAAVQPQNYTIADSIRLVGSSQQVDNNMLAVTLWWESLQVVSQDYLVELTLLDTDGQVVGYTLGHPVQGRYPIRAWEAGDGVEDTHLLPLSSSLSGDYRLVLNLLTRNGDTLLNDAGVALGPVNLKTPPADLARCAIFPMERRQLRPNASFTVISHEKTPAVKLSRQETNALPLRSSGPFHTFVVGPNWPASGQVVGADGVVCGELAFNIPLRNFEVPEIPQPLAANFNNEIELLGYEMPTHRIYPGGRLPLTLYWRALDYMGEDYQIFANPLDAGQQRWGGYDRRPRDGYSPLRWVPGEVITDAFGIPINANAPDGIYTIDVGLYQETTAGAKSLPLFQDEQPLEQRGIRLGPIKIGGPPAGVTAPNPAPQFVINQSLGKQITLLGYDAEIRGPKSENRNLKLTLYWQADAIPTADYTTFLHLRNELNETVAQKDSPPAGGRYPSSLWDSGEVIVDEIILPLDSLLPRQYVPVVGLYNPVTGQRLPTAQNPANEIQLNGVTLQ